MSHCLGRGCTVRVPLTKKVEFRKMSIDSLSEAIVKQALRELGEGDSELIAFRNYLLTRSKKYCVFIKSNFWKKSVPVF